MWPLLIAQASKKYSASPMQIGVNSEGSTESQPDDRLIVPISCEIGYENASQS